MIEVLVLIALGLGIVAMLLGLALLYLLAMATERIAAVMEASHRADLQPPPGPPLPSGPSPSALAEM
jgi:hypothetical protein